MSKTLAVTARELRERWLLFPTALALGIIPLTLPALGLHADDAPLIGLCIALAMSATAALLAGSSMLARDAHDGRLGFLFTRPLPWPTIWGGKWLAAIVLVIGSGFLATAPWMFTHPAPAHGGSWSTALPDPRGSIFLFLLLLLAIGLANFNATAFRSRSAWVGLDLALLLLAAWAFVRWVTPLYYLQIPPLAPPNMGWWGAVLPMAPVGLALLVASATQVAVGRTDIRRAHRAMSLTFWSLVFVALGAAGLRLAWARGATPADLTVNLGSHDPSGRWLYAFGGSRRGGAMCFLIDTDSGRFVSMDLEPRWANRSLGMAFAADGDSGVTLGEHEGATALRVADLRGDEPQFTVVPLESSTPPGDYGTRFALSPSGSRALLFRHGASLFSLPSGKRLAAAVLEPGWGPATARFTAESTARVWFFALNDPRAPRRRAEMLILDLSAGREPRRTRVPLEAVLDPVRSWPHAILADADGRRVLTRDAGTHLRDGESGALLATLVEGPAAVSALFLADGRIVVGEALGARTVVHVFAADGTPLSDAVLDRASSGLAVGPEVGPGQVVVHFGFKAANESVVVDVDEGRAIESLPGRHIMPGYWMIDSAPYAPGPGGSTAHFFLDQNRLVRWDFTTGQERTVAGPGAPPGERMTKR